MSTLDKVLGATVLLVGSAWLLWPLLPILKDEADRRALKKEFFLECLNQTKGDIPELYKKYVCYNNIYK